MSEAIYALVATLAGGVGAYAFSCLLCILGRVRSHEDANAIFLCVLVVYFALAGMFWGLT